MPHGAIDDDVADLGDDASHDAWVHDDLYFHLFAGGWTLAPGSLIGNFVDAVHDSIRYREAFAQRSPS